MKVFFILFSAVFISPIESEEKTSEDKITGSEKTSEADISKEEKLNLPGRICEIKITGLKRTKEDYIQEVLGDFKDKTASEVKKSAVVTCLQAQGLFSEINVNLEPAENGTDSRIVIDVKEKLTFFPMPFVYYSGDGVQGGVMVMDMNAGGRKNMMVTGGIFSATSQMGMFVFSKNSVDIKHPGFSTYLSFAHKDEDFENYGRDVICNLDRLTVTAQASVKERLAKNLVVSAGFKYSWNDVFDRDYGFVNQWAGTYGLNYTVSNWNGFYLNSCGLGFSGENGWCDNGSVIQAYKLNGFAEFPFIIPRLKMSFKVSGIWENGKNMYDKAGKSSIGSTILEGKFKSDFMTGGMWSFEGAFLKIKMMTLSLYGTYEVNYVQDSDDSMIFCHGPGAGLRIYMSKIAFPACHFGTSYNVSKNRWHFVFSLGMSF